MERKPNPPPGSGGSVVIKCKDFNVIHVDFANTEELNNISFSLESLSSIGIFSSYTKLSELAMTNLYFDTFQIIKHCTILSFTSLFTLFLKMDGRNSVQKSSILS